MKKNLQNARILLSNMWIVLHRVYWFYGRRQKSGKFYKLIFTARFQNNDKVILN